MLNFIKRRWILITGVLIIALAIFGFIKLRSNGAVETVFPTTGDLVRVVKISGKVVPQESVDLSFETSGTVSGIAKRVGVRVARGDLLVTIDASGISTNIQKAEAELALAQAELDKLGGQTNDQARISNAKMAVIQTIVDAYTDSNDAVYNKTDQFMLEPNSSKPEIGPTFVGYADLRNDVTLGRVLVGEILPKWGGLIANLNASNYTENYLIQSKQYLSQISAYIADVSRATSLFEESSVATQASIDAYRADAATARNNLNSASQALIAAEDSLKSLLLDVPAQLARVEAARATLANYRSQLGKSSLTSPINGVVSRQEAKVGQVVSPTSNLVSVISEGFEVEAFIPEVLIAGVEVGNPASVTLDAYGEGEVFEASVAAIDPAETIRDGVSTYKVRLVFSTPDSRIRSGMTSNIEIETFNKPGVVLIPERTVVRENGSTFVYILSGNKDGVKTEVVVGERDSSGNVELISPLSMESKLIINPVVN